MAPAFAALCACGDDGSTGPGPPQGNLRPTAVVQATPLSGDAPLVVTFDGSASTDPDGTVASWTWDFGDGLTGSGARVDHTYSDPGRFRARLVVADTRGARDTADVTIDVASPPGTGAATLAGTVWHDLDGNGSRDPGDPGSGGRTVYLDEDADGTRDANEPIALTDSVGAFSFSGLDETRAVRVGLEMTLGWTSTFSGPAPGPRPVRAAVVGGQDASILEFPFQVALLTSSSGFQFCGGSLLSATWVLTAAHCVDGLLPADVDVLAGTADLTQGGVRARVLRIRVYPQFGLDEGIDNDLALLEVDRPLPGRRIWPDTGEDPSLSEPGVVATVTGWGLLQASDPAGPTILQQAPIPIITQQACAQSFANLTDAMICGGPELGTDSCNGDSGGPLFVVDGVGWVQIGIVSFGFRCAAQPGVYARVSSLASYILANVPVDADPWVEVTFESSLERTVEFGTFR